MKHVMVDLETMGNISNSVILSIGAVKFDLETGETGEEFYKRVDLDSCLEYGLKVTASTIKWWLRQSEEARIEVTEPGELLIKVLHDFSKFVSYENILWSNGLRFDVALLEDAYIETSMAEAGQMPWDFHKERDVRTLVSFNPKIKERVVKEWDGILHNPVDDCKLQIKYCSEIYKSLKK